GSNPPQHQGNGRGAETTGRAQTARVAAPRLHQGDGQGSETSGRAHAAPDAVPQQNQGDGQGESRPEEGSAQAENNRLTAGEYLTGSGTGKRPRVAAHGRRNADAGLALAALNPRALNFLAGSVPCRGKGREIILASGVQPGPAFWPLSLCLPWLSS